MTKQVQPGSARCLSCKTIKSVSAFNKNKSKKNGLQDYCKHCFTVYRQTPKSKSSKLKSTYGLDWSQYVALFEEQNYRCAICKTGVQPFTKNAHVDHEHVNGYKKLPAEQKRLHVRGILCNRCNHGLGQFRDSQTSLAAAQIYLAEHDMRSR